MHIQRPAVIYLTDHKQAWLVLNMKRITISDNKGPMVINFSYTSISGLLHVTSLQARSRQQNALNQKTSNMLIAHTYQG